MTLKNFSQSKALYQLVRSHVPKCRVEADDHQTINANVGGLNVNVLISLLKNLEEKKESLLLDSVSVSVSALEDVLRRVERGSEETSPSRGATPQLPDCPCALIDANKAFPKGTRPRRMQRFGALMIKRAQYGRRDFRLPLLMVFLPLSVRMCLIA